MSRKQALKYKVVTDIESVTQLYFKSSGKIESNSNSLTDSGFVVGFWTGHKEEESSGL